MAYSTVPKVRRDGKITLFSGATNLEIQYEEGNLSFDFTKPDQTVIRDRGIISTVRKGDEQPITGSFNAFFRQFTDGSEAGSLLDFINKEGAYAGNTSVTGTVYVEEYSIAIKYEVEGDNFGDDADHSIQLNNCVAIASFAEGDPSSFTINFTSYDAPTITGPA